MDSVYTGIFDRDKTYDVDPTTFTIIGMTEEQKSWTPVTFDGQNILIAGQWLLERNITEWVWKNRTPDRMAWRSTIWFKNPQEATLFALWK